MHSKYLEGWFQDVAREFETVHIPMYILKFLYGNSFEALYFILFHSFITPRPWADRPGFVRHFLTATIVIAAATAMIDAEVHTSLIIVASFVIDWCRFWESGSPRWSPWRWVSGSPRWSPWRWVSGSPRWSWTSAPYKQRFSNPSGTQSASHGLMILNTFRSFFRDFFTLHTEFLRIITHIRASHSWEYFPREDLSFFR